MRRAKLARFLNLTGITCLLSRLSRWSGVLCLNYHRIGNGDDSIFDRGVWSATAEAFEEQVRLLKSNFDVVSPRDLPAIIASKTGRHVCVSFDDGYIDNYEIAFPILKSHQVPATFFVSTSFLDDRKLAWWDEIAWMVRSSTRKQLNLDSLTPVPIEFDGADREPAIHQVLAAFKSIPSDRTDAFLEELAKATGSGRYDSAVSTSPWMTWDMLREMKSAGMSIGGHTVSHPILANMAQDGQWHEISTCAQRIEDELGEPMQCFSYPQGKPDTFNQITRDCLHKAGVRFAFSYYGGCRDFSDWDDYDIRRVGVVPYITQDWFRAIVCLPRIFT